MYYYCIIDADYWSLKLLTVLFFFFFALLDREMEIHSVWLLDGQDLTEVAPSRTLYEVL